MCDKQLLSIESKISRSVLPSHHLPFWNASPPTPAQTVQSERTLFIHASVEATNKNMGKKSL